MPTLNAAELARLRIDWNAMLTDTCKIQRKVFSRTAAGGTLQTYSDIASAAPAQLLPIASHSERQERDQAGRLTSVQLWAVDLQHGTDITAADRVLFGNRSFEVISVQSWLSNEVGRVAICAEVV